MPLSFSGESQDTHDFQKLLIATDENDLRVLVISSVEAIQDYGLSLVQQKASDKYDDNQLDEHGRVEIRTSDFS